MVLESGVSGLEVEAQSRCVWMSATECAGDGRGIPHIGEVVRELAFKRPAEEADLLVPAAGHGVCVESCFECAIQILGFLGTEIGGCPRR
jgi:hypothetical protein